MAKWKDRYRYCLCYDIVPVFCGRRGAQENKNSASVGAEIAQSVQRLATGWAVRGSNPGGGEIFRIRPDRPWGPPSLLHIGYRVFPRVKRPGRGADHPPPSSAEVEGRVELYIYSPSRFSWPVLGRSLPLLQPM